MPRAHHPRRAGLFRGLRLPVAGLFECPALRASARGRRDAEGARTLALARQAVALAPGSSWAQYALALAFWFTGDVGRGLEALETGRALNPNDTTIIADLGQRYAMLADWDRAVPLLDEAFGRNPAQPGSYRIGMFLYHYAHGRFEEALAEAHAVGGAHVVYGWIAIAAAAAKLGRAGEASAAIDAILAIDPRYGERVVEDLQARHLDPGLLLAVIDGLRLAGLPGIDAGAAPTSGKSWGSPASATEADGWRLH